MPSCLPHSGDSRVVVVCWQRSGEGTPQRSGFTQGRSSSLFSRWETSSGPLPAGPKQDATSEILTSTRSLRVVLMVKERLAAALITNRQPDSGAAAAAPRLAAGKLRLGPAAVRGGRSSRACRNTDPLKCRLTGLTFVLLAAGKAVDRICACSPEGAGKGQNEQH